MMHVGSWGIGGEVVDAGVPGRAWLGASRGGAVDAAALALANRLLGNPPEAAAVETSGGLELRLDEAAMVVLTGALAEVEVRGGPPLGWGAPVALPAGAVVRVRRLVEGARAYLGVRGGLQREGDGLQVGSEPRQAPSPSPAPRPAWPGVAGLWDGPRADWFAADALERMCTTRWRVDVTSRVGVRLDGPPLVRLRDGELPSEGMVEGAVQVPPDGRPIVMLADHPATGGYPVLAVVDPADLWVLAQAAPGARLTFSRRTPRRPAG